MHTFVQEVRQALRALARRPGFTIAAVLTLALGIGANTAIFSAVNAVLLHPLPTPGLDRLVVIHDDLPGINLRDAQVSPGETVDLEARTDLFDAVTGVSGASATLAGPEEPRRLAAAYTMGDFFRVFGVHPAAGRFYTTENSAPGASDVAVVSWGLARQMGGASAVVGRMLDLDGRRVQVIGVMPRDFRYPSTAELWMPFVLTPRKLSPQQRMSLYITAVARLRPGITDAQLRGQLAAETRRWHERNPDSYDAKLQHRITVQSFTTWRAGVLRPVLLVLLAAVALVLLIAIANVASLQLVRAMSRVREVAIRAALGASRGRLVRQLLTESLLLALLGGALGLWLGALMLDAIRSRWAAAYPQLASVGLDARVLAFGAALAVVAGIVFGIVPALRVSRADVRSMLDDAARGATAGVGRGRFLQGSVVVQVAFALVLLLGAGVMIRSMANLLRTDPGFRPEQVFTARISLPGYSTPKLTPFWDQLVARLDALPGVQAAGVVNGLPMSGGSDSSPFEIVGEPKAPTDPERHANLIVASGGYFRALGIPLLAGRLFDSTDTKTSMPVALIDETLAKTYFHGENPIGRRIDQGMPATIVGVVGSVKQEDLGAPARATAYYPYTQHDWISGKQIVLRSALPAEQLGPMVRTVVRQMDPTVPVFDIQPMGERLSESLGARRMAMTVLAGLAALALVLSLLGVYGVISYTMSQRTRELGIRVALGAQVSDVVGMVLRRGLVLAAIGLVIGGVVYLEAGRVLDSLSLLSGVRARDPLTIIVAAALVGAAALVACWLPARRAARVDPVEAMRTE